MRVRRLKMPMAAMLLAYYAAPTVFLAPVLTALIQTMLLFVITLAVKPRA